MTDIFGYRGLQSSCVRKRNTLKNKLLGPLVVVVTETVEENDVSYCHNNKRDTCFWLPCWSSWPPAVTLCSSRTCSDMSSDVMTLFPVCCDLGPHNLTSKTMIFRNQHFAAKGPFWRCGFCWSQTRSPVRSQKLSFSCATHLHGTLVAESSCVHLLSSHGGEFARLSLTSHCVLVRGIVAPYERTKEGPKYIGYSVAMTLQMFCAVWKFLPALRTSYQQFIHLWARMITDSLQVHSHGTHNTLVSSLFACLLEVFFPWFAHSKFLCSPASSSSVRRATFTSRIQLQPQDKVHVHTPLGHNQPLRQDWKYSTPYCHNLPLTHRSYS